MTTKTIYIIKGHVLHIPDSGLLNSDLNNQTVTYEVRPNFNYLAANYNDSYSFLDERNMPTPYSEILQNETLEASYSISGFNVIMGGNIDAGQEDSIAGAASPRQVFLGGAGSISSRNSVYLPVFNDIILTNSSKTCLANSLAHYFPQHVEIVVSGAPIKNSAIALSCLSETGGFYNLIADFVINRQNEAEEDKDQNGNNLRHWKFWETANAETIALEAAALVAEETFDDTTNTDTILGNQSLWVPDDTLECINPIDIEEMLPLSDRDLIFDNITSATQDLFSSSGISLSKDQFLFYKVEKYDNDKPLTPVQTFWVANTSTSGSNIKIVDTQVKVGKTYTYKCFGFYLSFKKTPIVREIRMFEVPMFEQSCKIEQPSLPRPQVSFSNIKNSKDEIKIMLNLSSNPENGEFYGLNPSEKGDFDTRHENYDITKEKDKFVYETDLGRYQIYKMTEQPQMGETNDPYTNIIENSITGSVEGDFGGTAAHFIDKIRPFKKYYYVFRNVNHYGHFSNPSPIWEVELTQDANETFLSSKVVGFAKPNMDKFLLSKTMMRMFQVIPSPAQTTFDPNSVLTVTETETIKDIDGNQIFGYYDDDGNIIQIGHKGIENTTVYLEGIENRIDFGVLKAKSDFLSTTDNNVSSLQPYNSNNPLPTLGIVPEKIWTTIDSSGNTIDEGKRFKIRLVSKDTGRKIDFNLRFVLNKNYNTNGPN